MKNQMTVSISRSYKSIQAYLKYLKKRKAHFERLNNFRKIEILNDLIDIWEKQLKNKNNE